MAEAGGCVKQAIVEIRLKTGSHDSRQLDDGFGQTSAGFGQLSLLASVLGRILNPHMPGGEKIFGPNSRLSKLGC
jgi:hypothetical protein